MLSRAFGTIAAVADLDLRVAVGSIYGFLGPNGSGKTTTIKMLLGLLTPDRGEISVFGSNPLRDRRAVLGRVGAMVEVPSLYGHLTGRENLEITRRLIGGIERSAIDRALALVDLRDAADRKVKGYSLGMKQRLSLALAMQHNPDLLILDEPTNGLDPAGIREMRELIARLPREMGVTIFLSSHLLSEVEQVATHVGIVNHGRLLFQGTLAELHSKQALALRLRVANVDSALALLRRELWPQAMSNNGSIVGPIESEAVVPEIGRLLVNGGHDIYELRIEKPSLEASFLTMTASPTSAEVTP